MPHEGDEFNALDPNHFVELEGRSRLVFGSSWTGIKMRRLDPLTGKPLPAKERVFSVARRPVPRGGPEAIEGPFMFQRQRNYSLFTSYDYCCMGARSTYHTAYGRVWQVTGPFLGRDGGAAPCGSGHRALEGRPAPKGAVAQTGSMRCVPRRRSRLYRVSRLRCPPSRDSAGADCAPGVARRRLAHRGHDVSAGGGRRSARGYSCEACLGRARACLRLA